MSNENNMPYEGAGFLLSFKDQAILGKRIKKEKDLLSDPTAELEYMGGRIEEVADKNAPSNTAHAELIEELGADILDADWKDRAKIIHIFQPFSKKSIWCFRLELNQAEYDRLIVAAQNLATWPVTETRDFSKLTGRSEPARKALARLALVPLANLANYVESFANFPTQNGGNRMKDAKDFRVGHRLSGVDLLDTDIKVEHALRGFNTLMFVNHISELLK